MTQSTLRKLYETAPMQNFLESPAGLTDFCKSCPYIRLCGGGCKRLREAMYMRKGEAFCGLRALLNQHGPAFAEVAQTQRQQR